MRGKLGAFLLGAIAVTVLITGAAAWLRWMPSDARVREMKQARSTAETACVLLSEGKVVGDTCYPSEGRSVPYDLPAGPPSWRFDKEDG